MQIRQAEQDYKGSCGKLADIVSTWKADMTSCCVVSANVYTRILF